MSVLWSPDFDAYASGELDASKVRCVLCGQAPCMCPPFGTPEYFALIDYRHGRTGGELPEILRPYFRQVKPGESEATDKENPQGG